MKVKARSIQQLVESQCMRWETEKKAEDEKGARPVIAISREAGSLGRPVAIKLSEDLGMLLSGKNIINEVAESLQMSEEVVKTLDEKGRSWVDDIIASLIGQDGLVSDEYFQHLTKVIGTIGRHGNAIIVGRGAGFILPPEKTLRLRFIAPLNIRVSNVMKEKQISAEAAERQISMVDSNRRSFIRKYFRTDIDDPLNCDLMINNEFLDLNASVALIKAALSRRFGLPEN